MFRFESRPATAFLFLAVAFGFGDDFYLERLEHRFGTTPTPPALHRIKTVTTIIFVDDTSYWIHVGLLASAIICGFVTFLIAAYFRDRSRKS